MLAICPFRLYNLNMSQPLQLFRLQQVDTKLDQARARLKDIETALQNDDALKNAQQLAEDAGKALHKAKTELIRAETEVNGQEQKIEKNQKILYSGTIKNPKELEDLQNEAAALKRYLAVLEDRQLEKMITAEEADSKNSSALSNLSKTEEKTAQRNTDLVVEQKQLLESVAKLESDRLLLITAVSEDNQAIYNRLRGSSNGLAVAEVDEKTCSACGATLTASQAQDARSPTSITFCDSCGRILYSS